MFGNSYNFGPIFTEQANPFFMAQQDAFPIFGQAAQPFIQQDPFMYSPASTYNSSGVSPFFNDMRNMLGLAYSSMAMPFMNFHRFMHGMPGMDYGMNYNPINSYSYGGNQWFIENSNDADMSFALSAIGSKTNSPGSNSSSSSSNSRSSSRKRKSTNNSNQSSSSNNQGSNNTQNNNKTQGTNNNAQGSSNAQNNNKQTNPNLDPFKQLTKILNDFDPTQFTSEKDPQIDKYLKESSTLLKDLYKQASTNPKPKLIQLLESIPNSKKVILNGISGTQNINNALKIFDKEQQADYTNIELYALKGIFNTLKDQIYELNLKYGLPKWQQNSQTLLNQLGGGSSSTNNAIPQNNNNNTQNTPQKGKNNVAIPNNTQSNNQTPNNNSSAKTNVLSNYVTYFNVGFATSKTDAENYLKNSTAAIIDLYKNISSTPDQSILTALQSMSSNTNQVMENLNENSNAKNTIQKLVNKLRSNPSNKQIIELLEKHSEHLTMLNVRFGPPLSINTNSLINQKSFKLKNNTVEEYFKKTHQTAFDSRYGAGAFLTSFFASRDKASSDSSFKALIAKLKKIQQDDSVNTDNAIQELIQYKKELDTNWFKIGNPKVQTTYNLSNNFDAERRKLQDELTKNNIDISLASQLTGNSMDPEKRYEIYIKVKEKLKNLNNTKLDLYLEDFKNKFSSKFKEPSNKIHYIKPSLKISFNGDKKVFTDSIKTLLTNAEILSLKITDVQNVTDLTTLAYSSVSNNDMQENRINYKDKMLSILNSAKTKLPSKQKDIENSIKLLNEFISKYKEFYDPGYEIEIK